MPAPSDALPNTIDQGGKWFWNFLKQELSPFPGRAWIVGRVTISATIVMMLVMTFRIPNGFLGAIFTFLLSRENPTATLRAGLRTVAVFLVGTVYTAFSVRLLIGDPLDSLPVGCRQPLPHFLSAAHRRLCDRGSPRLHGIGDHSLVGCKPRSA